MSLINTPLLMAGGGYEITRSVRLRASASAYFNRTPASQGNRRIWTWSGWVKRGTLGAEQVIMSAGTNGSSTNLAFFMFNSSDAIQFYVDTGAANYSIITTQVFRDPSAWYHLVFVLDTPQATASDRMKIYVNGVQVTAFSTANYTPQNNTYGINDTLAHNLGRYVFNNTRYFDGYMAEINLIDGQALTPSSFGFIDPSTGVWGPRKYTGTYGTNGFYLNFTDNSAATATTIGKDYSGNGNNWTPNNISVTAGVTYDSMIDSPTQFNDGGNGRGNYATFNPLETGSGIPGTLSNANLTISGTSVLRRATIAFPLTGKWYCEMFVNAVGSSVSFSYDSRGQGSATQFIQYNSAGTKNINGTTTSYGASFTTNDVIGMAVDADSGVVTFYKNNASQGDLTFSSASMSGVSAFATVFVDTGGASASINFGQRPFTYTPPTGFKALNTQNLPQPTIPNGASYMAATLWTGNGSARSITNTVNSVSFQPDLVWVKSRTQAIAHRLIDSVRGAGNTLASNLTNAEFSDPQGVTSFNSNGFGVGTDTSYNQNGDTYVGWQWRANGTPAVTNTNGSITSTVSANTTAGFSVVTWAGNSTSGATIGHGLGVAPKLIITKSRTNPSSWVVGIGNISGFSVNDYLSLNSTNGKLSSSTFYQAYGASTFTVGVSAADEMNKTGNNYVAYCFSAVAGYSAFGSYTGNGSSDGPFVFLGFRPRWVMWKRSDSTSDWEIVDAERPTRNVVTGVLYANLSNAEVTSSGECDFTANGFKIRDNSNRLNTNGGTYIYAAFCENPFKFALAR